MSCQAGPWEPLVLGPSALQQEVGDGFAHCRGSGAPSLLRASVIKSLSGQHAGLARPSGEGQEGSLGDPGGFLMWWSLAGLICLQTDGCGGRGDVRLVAGSRRTASFPDLLWGRACTGPRLSAA